MMPIAASRPVPAYDSKASVRSSFWPAAPTRSATSAARSSSPTTGAASAAGRMLSKSAANCLNHTSWYPPHTGSGSPQPYTAQISFSTSSLSSPPKSPPSVEQKRLRGISPISALTPRPADDSNASERSSRLCCAATRSAFISFDARSCSTPRERSTA